MTNKLPPLPPIPFVQIEDALVAWATEYGQQCRDAALEEAAKAAEIWDSEPLSGHSIAFEIRALKEKKT